MNVEGALGIANFSAPAMKLTATAKTNTIITNPNFLRVIFSPPRIVILFPAACDYATTTNLMCMPS
jgi:hypothetical protein